MRADPQAGMLCGCLVARRTHWAHSGARETDGLASRLWVLWCDDCGGQLRICSIQRGVVVLDQTTPRGSDPGAPCLCGARDRWVWEVAPPRPPEEDILWTLLCRRCRGVLQRRLCAPGETPPAAEEVGQEEEGEGEGER